MRTSMFALKFLAKFFFIFFFSTAVVADPWSTIPAHHQLTVVNREPDTHLVVVYLYGQKWDFDVIRKSEKSHVSSIWQVSLNSGSLFFICWMKKGSKSFDYWQLRNSILGPTESTAQVYSDRVEYEGQIYNINDNESEHYERNRNIKIFSQILDLNPEDLKHALLDGVKLSKP